MGRAGSRVVTWYAAHSSRAVVELRWLREHTLESTIRPSSCVGVNPEEPVLLLAPSCRVLSPLCDSVSTEEAQRVLLLIPTVGACDDVDALLDPLFTKRRQIFTRN